MVSGMRRFHLNLYLIRNVWSGCSLTVSSYGGRSALRIRTECFPGRNASTLKGEASPHFLLSTYTSPQGLSVRIRWLTWRGDCSAAARFADASRPAAVDGS